MLTALGLRRKIRLPASTPVLGVLRRGRRLRGSPFDPFGRSALRRTERRLPDQYRRLVDSALAHLTPESAALVTQIAELPDLVRGYEDVKWEGIAAFGARAGTLLDALRGTAGDRGDLGGHGDHSGGGAGRDVA